MGGVHGARMTRGVVAMGCFAGIGAAPALAVTDHEVSSSGSLVYTWSGDPARNCAAEGLCGVGGSIEASQVSGFSTAESSGTPPIEIQDGGAVARVDDAVGGVEHPCVDLVPVDVGFQLRHRAAGGLRAVGSSEFAGAPSAGECAGPTAADLARVALPVHNRGHGRYDLSGTVRFGAGPFEVTAVYRVGHSFTQTTQISLPPKIGSLPKTTTRLVEQAHVDYRIAAIRGALTTSFAARAGLSCDALDACGAGGALRLTLTRGRRMLTFSGQRFVKRAVGPRRAVADLFAGRLPIAESLYAVDLGDTVTGTVSGAGMATCVDGVSTRPVDLSSRMVRGVDRFKLDPSSDVLGAFAAEDPLRTRCPGPGAAEILRRGALATGGIALDTVGARRIELSLHARGRFGGAAYAGARSGTITLELARGKASGGTGRVREG
jgi:hypothetical protein